MSVREGFISHTGESQPVSPREGAPGLLGESGSGLSLHESPG